MHIREIQFEPRTITAHNLRPEVGVVINSGCGHKCLILFNDGLFIFVVAALFVDVPCHKHGSGASEM